MRTLVCALVALLMGEPADLAYESATVWLFALVSGWLIVSTVEATQSDWMGMTVKLPANLTYDPGESEFVGGLELTYVPAQEGTQAAVATG